jgi:S1-C subfamily serine protease
MKLTSHLFNQRLMLGVLAVSLSAGTALADTKDTAKAVFEKNKEAVIKVTAVVKIEVPGRSSQGQNVEISGTVIGADGLTVVSAASINPAAALLDAASDEQIPNKPKVELTEIKYLLADGTEIPGRLVYKDKDLDLAFLVPDRKEGEPAPKFTSLEVKEGPKAHELDDIISLARLSKNMSHAPSVAIGQISATITKPRTVYDFTLSGTPTTGTPVFTGSGELLGFCMIHHDDGGADPAKLRAMMSGRIGNEVVIMPAGEVAALVDSARKAAAKSETKPVAEDKPVNEAADKSK